VRPSHSCSGSPRPAKVPRSRAVSHSLAPPEPPRLSRRRATRRSSAATSSRSLMSRGQPARARSLRRAGPAVASGAQAWGRGRRGGRRRGLCLRRRRTRRLAGTLLQPFVEACPRRRGRRGLSASGCRSERITTTRPSRCPSP
jgi:hypothetical protein